MAIDTKLFVHHIPPLNSVSPVQHVQIPDAAQSVHRFDLFQTQMNMINNEDLEQINNFIAAQISAVTRSQVCVVPYWTNEEDVRRKAIKRTQETRPKKKSNTINDKDLVVMEVGFTSGMLSLFLNSPTAQRDAIREIQKFTQFLNDSDQEGGVYFLDETQAVIWTRDDASQAGGPDDIQVKWMHPQALLSVGMQPVTNHFIPPPIQVHPSVMQKVAPATQRQIAEKLQSSALQPSSEQPPRKGFFRGYED